MLEITDWKNGQTAVIEDGQRLVSSRNLMQIAKFLNEEKPEEVEAHIFSGNSIHFNVSLEKEDFLKNLIHQQFNQEQNIFFESDD